MGGQEGQGTGSGGDTLKSGADWIKRPAGVHL